MAVCKHCNKEFKPQGKGQHTYCSSECANVIVKCSTCNENVIIKRSVYNNKIKDGYERFFCNRTCYLELHKTKVPVTICEHCGKSFIGQVKNANKFCSRECYNNSKYHSKVTSGENHWQWKGGISKGERNSPEYAAFRMEVLKRDDFTCKYCKQRGGKLEAHHIKSWKLYPEHRMNADNLITVCTKCHDEIHFKFGLCSKLDMVL